MENNKKTSPENAGQKPATTPLMSESNWIMNGINQLDRRIDGMDGRLRKVEKQISHMQGWGTAMFIILVILQIALRFVNVEIALK